MTTQGRRERRESEKRGNERNIKGNEEGSRKRWKIRRCRTEKNLLQKENTVGKCASGSEGMGNVPEKDGLEVAGEGTTELEMKRAEGRVSEYKRNWERR